MIDNNNNNKINDRNNDNVDNRYYRFRFVSLLVVLGVLCTSLAAVLIVSNGNTNIYFGSFMASSSSQANGEDLLDPSLVVTDPSITVDTTYTDITDTTTGTDDLTSEISFSFARVGYAPLDLKNTILYYNFLANYDFVVEPYSASQISVDEYAEGTVYYTYTICPSDISSGSSCQVGSLSNYEGVASMPATVHCTPFTKYTITVTEINSVSGGTTRTTSKNGMCMYVRREIRQMSEADLNNFLDALYTMYSISEVSGQELYGYSYHNYAYLLNFHHFNAAWQESDHIHEGNGFLAQHIKMTNMVETCLQAINPGVTLPYWDFTIDQSEGKSSISSAVMTPDIFGSMNQPTDITWGFTYENDLIVDAAIPDGRWAYFETEKNAIYTDLKKGYGYMRAPWNMNPSPYVSRFSMDLQVGTSLPTCAQHYDMLEYTNMMDFYYDIQYGPHATTHSLSGGIYGCDQLSPLLDAGYISDETSLKLICSNWIFYMKEFYRYNYISPNSDCVVEDDIQSSECGFTCGSDTTDMKFNLKNKISGYVPSDISEDGWSAWVDFICTGNAHKIFSGDHLESASPADPSFWVIHPTLERLTHAKLMAGGFANEDLATDPINDKVCDKAECYEESAGTKDYYDDCCYGHYEFDKILDFTTGNKSNYWGATNGATMAATDPRKATYSMNYIYDSFSWSHCEEDFQGLMETLFQDWEDEVVYEAEEGVEVNSESSKGGMSVSNTVTTESSVSDVVSTSSSNIGASKSSSNSGSSNSNSNTSSKASKSSGSSVSSATASSKSSSINSSKSSKKSSRR
jgi:hypothetical protein